MSCSPRVIQAIATGTYTLIKHSALCEYCAANVGVSVMITTYRDLLNASIEDDTRAKTGAADDLLSNTILLLLKLRAEPDLTKRRDLLQAVATKGSDLLAGDDDTKGTVQ